MQHSQSEFYQLRRSGWNLVQREAKHSYLWDIFVYMETNDLVSSNQQEDPLMRGTLMRWSHQHLQADIARKKWWFYSKILKTFLGPDAWRHMGKGGKLPVVALGSCTGCLWAQLCAVSLILHRGKGPCSHPGLHSGRSWLVDSRIGPRSDMFTQMIKKSASGSLPYLAMLRVMPRRSISDFWTTLGRRKLGYIQSK